MAGGLEEALNPFTHHQKLPLVHHLVAVRIKHIEGNLKASMGLWRTHREEVL